MAQVPFLTHPPTSFPLRDILLLQQLPLRPRERICEIGVGSGHTLAALAKLGADVTGLEISRPVVQRLRRLARRRANLEIRQADVTREEDVAPLHDSFSWVVSCDTLEHVPDAAAFFRSLSRLLQPGGRFLVTFPNEPRERMHGVTRFDRPEDLSRLLAAAGLTDHQLGAAHLRPGPAHIAQALGLAPLRQVRRLLRRRDHEGSAQTFEQTRFHRDADLWWRLSPLVNLYWHLVQRLMTACGPAFEVDWGFARSSFEECQVVIEGRKPDAARIAPAPASPVSRAAPLPALPLTAGTLSGLEADLVELGLPFVTQAASTVLAAL